MLYIENLSMLAKMLLGSIPEASAKISGNGVSGRVNFYKAGNEGKKIACGVIKKSV